MKTRRPEESRLDLPAGLVVRALAIDQARRARDALKRSRKREDDAALHDARVAIRRLRAILRAFRPLLGSPAVDRDERRLRRLARETGATRDIEAQLEWLRRPDARWSPLARRGAELVAAELERLRDRAAPHYQETARALGELLDRMERRLSVWKVEVDPEALGAPPRMRGALAAAAGEAAARLGARLDAAAAADGEAVHRARIAAKRLRYLLRPFRDDIPDARELLSGLASLQETAGDLRDVELLHRRVDDEVRRFDGDDTRRAALLALGERLGAMRDSMRGELAERWLGGAGESLAARAAACARTIGGPGEGVEIERKYLLTAMPDLPDAAEPLEVYQGWIPGSLIHERIRRVRSAGGERWYRTIKLGSGVRRIEIEEEIEPDLARPLWRLTRGRRVSKRRYRVPVGALVWEIDRFTDRALVLAEVELPSVDAEVELPGWLAPHVDREVTGDAAYVNLNLAR